MTKLFSLFIILSFVLPVSGQEKLDSDKARKEKAYHLTGSVREQGERPYPDPLPDASRAAVKDMVEDISGALAAAK